MRVLLCSTYDRECSKRGQGRLFHERGAIMPHRQQLIDRRIADLKPYPGNARTHSRKQVKQIAASIQRFGFANPVLISDDGEIIAGHGRVEAAKLLGWSSVPTIALSHLSDAERRAYVLADNKLALNAGWDREILAIELQALVDLEFDIELTGFSLAEVDFVLDEASDADPAGTDQPEDHVPTAGGPAVAKLGDVWMLELAMHPTVKPTALIADAIRDCSRRGEIVLDCFGGSGSTLIAAEKTGRQARLIEFDPLYCDTIVRRWQLLTGKMATLAGDGRTFEALSDPDGMAEAAE